VSETYLQIRGPENGGVEVVGRRGERLIARGDIHNHPLGTRSADQRSPVREW
jgi:hypothetical protein